MKSQLQKTKVKKEEAQINAVENVRAGRKSTVNEYVYTQA
jgi:hypothetical protein